MVSATNHIPEKKSRNQIMFLRMVSTTNHIRKENRNQIMFFRMLSAISHIPKKRRKEIQFLPHGQESMTLQTDVQEMPHMAKESQGQVKRGRLPNVQNTSPHQIKLLRRIPQTAKESIGPSKKKNLDQTKFLFRNSVRTTKWITRLQVSFLFPNSSPFMLSCRSRAPARVVRRLADIASHSNPGRTLSHRATARRSPPGGAAGARSLHPTRCRSPS
jgi:hypothetical protein